MRGFDVIGNIAVINLPYSSRRQQQEARRLAKKLLKFKYIKTVAIKSGKFKGKLRKASYTIIAGLKSLETIHRENGCLIKLNIAETYFSPRLAADRLEIAKQVKQGEKVLVMFAGVLPYTLAIARNSKAKEIYAVEINRAAIKYAKENIKLNKVGSIRLIQGDVKKIALQLRKKGLKFNRIVMPRPQLKETFLKEAFMLAARGCIIHYHDFLREEEIAGIVERIQQKAKNFNQRIKMLYLRKIGEIAPHKYRVRVDFKVL